MPRFPIPTHRYSDIASTRLSTQSALSSSIPTSDHIPEAPRCQCDTMKSYQRLEKAGTIASMESQQQNVRPLFAYPRRQFETPRRRVSPETAAAQSREEDTLPFLPSSLIDTSDFLDSILSSSSHKEHQGKASSPPTSMLDFSSSLPYPPEQRVWRSSPPVRLPERRTYLARDIPPSQHISMDGYVASANDSVPYLPELEFQESSPLVQAHRRRSDIHQRRRVSNDFNVQSTGTNSERSQSSQSRRQSQSSYQHSSPSLLDHPDRRSSEPRTTSTHRSRRHSYNAPSRSEDFTSRHRQRRTSRRMTSSPVMRYVTVLEDISEDEPLLAEGVGMDSATQSRRSMLRLRIGRFMEWILRR